MSKNEKTKGGRDARGRFEAGNPGGPGNPYARRVAEMKKAMLAAVSLIDMAEIAQAMVKKAKEGNVQAAKLIFSYVLGKPEAGRDVDRVDGHEWEVQKESAGMFAEMGPVMQSPPAEVTLGATRVMRPIMGQVAVQQMAGMMARPGEYFEEYREGEKPAGPLDSPARHGDDGEPRDEASAKRKQVADSKRRFAVDGNGKTMFGGRMAGMEPSANGKK